MVQMSQFSCGAIRGNVVRRPVRKACCALDGQRVSTSKVIIRVSLLILVLAASRTFWLANPLSPQGTFMKQGTQFGVESTASGEASQNLGRSEALSV